MRARSNNAYMLTTRGRQTLAARIIIKLGLGYCGRLRHFFYRSNLSPSNFVIRSVRVRVDSLARLWRRDSRAFFDISSILSPRSVPSSAIRHLMFFDALRFQYAFQTALRTVSYVGFGKFSLRLRTPFAYRPNVLERS